VGWRLSASKDEYDNAAPLDCTPPTIAPGEIAGPPLVPFSWADQLPVVKIDWLVRDFFAEKSLNLMIGASQAGKSYLALDLAVAIATGRPFLGKSVRQGGVLYVATEGQITISRRLMAAHQGQPLAGKLIAVVLEPPSDLMKEEDVDRIIATAKYINGQMLMETGLPLRMIIIDTMISGFGIGDWNNVADTSDAMKVLRRIKDEVGVAVTGVHHHGKDTSRGAAGSYALTAHPDAILSVYKKDNDGAVKRRWVTLTKSRFGVTGRKLAFDLVQKPPDHRDGDGDDEAFVVLSKDATSDSHSIGSKSSRADECFRSSCESALEHDGKDFDFEDGPLRAVRLSAAKNRFMDLYKPKGSGGDPAEATRKAWIRALAKSKKNSGGPIGHDQNDEGEDWIYRVEDSEPDSDVPEE
jgi:hypothetical protein